MPAVRDRRRAANFGLVLGALLLTWGTPARAHKLMVFALVEGTTINGEAYFAGRRPAQDVAVEAFAPDGRQLFVTTTDANGRFSLTVHAHVDHRIVVNSGDGHAAEYIIHAAELPSGLMPEPVAVEERPKPSAPELNMPAPAPATSSMVAADAQTVERAVDRALSRQLGPLREQLAQERAEVMWRDVLGGIGYILGLTGIACWVSARRRSSRNGDK